MTTPARAPVIRWNAKAESYTVANAALIVRDIPARSQAVCVQMELRNGWPVSFGTAAVRA